jgi:hypothetical protein
MLLKYQLLRHLAQLSNNISTVFSESNTPVETLREMRRIPLGRINNAICAKAYPNTPFNTSVRNSRFSVATLSLRTFGLPLYRLDSCRFIRHGSPATSSSPAPTPLRASEKSGWTDTIPVATAAARPCWSDDPPAPRIHVQPIDLLRNVTLKHENHGGSKLAILHYGSDNSPQHHLADCPYAKEISVEDNKLLEGSQLNRRLRILGATRVKIFLPRTGPAQGAAMRQYRFD